ncbi:hypothetical protein T484DRAFT_1775888 [Baffinella frigidus]|nr:hypothetical protein T484DRAFT_1775888 [Cryptophyta sp. CCMP2293]
MPAGAKAEAGEARRERMPARARDARDTQGENMVASGRPQTAGAEGQGKDAGKGVKQAGSIVLLSQGDENFAVMRSRSAWAALVLVSLVTISRRCDAFTGHALFAAPPLLRSGMHSSTSHAAARTGAGVLARPFGARRRFQPLCALEIAPEQGRVVEGGGVAAGGGDGAGGKSILMDLQSLGDALGGTGKAKLVWESIRAGRDPWTDPGVTEKARGILGRDFKRYPEISASSDSGDSRTVKLLMMLEDGMEVEAV